MSELKFAKTHEWVKLDDNKATIGITDHAQSELGDIVFVELPEVGSQIKKGEPFGVIESVKVASDLYAPCSGKVIEKNDDLKDIPGLVNEDAFGKGWMIQVEISDKNELSDLLDEAGYKDLI